MLEIKRAQLFEWASIHFVESRSFVFDKLLLANFLQLQHLAKTLGIPHWKSLCHLKEVQDQTGKVFEEMRH